MKTYTHILLILLAITSCTTQKSQNDATANLQETHTFGTITNKTQLDGCSYVITLSNNTVLEPLNLDSLFMQDGLNVYFQYKKSNAMTICMSGQPITLLEITKAKK